MPLLIGLITVGCTAKRRRHDRPGQFADRLGQRGGDWTTRNQ